MKKMITILLSFLFVAQLPAQISSAEIDSLALATMKAFDVPGIAIGVVKDGELIHAKGYGVRSTTSQLPVDEETLFGIASNSKAFTATALAMMVEEGKLSWDDPVRKYIPEFTLYNPFVTENFTVRDLLVHRSGMGLGAGDLMFFPEGGDITVKDVIHNLRYMKAESSFRSKYAYNNNMYIVAGEVLRVVSGLSWERFIEERIMQPLGFEKSKASYNRVTDKSNIIDAHVVVDGKIKQIPHDWSETANAAGGIMSNIKDLSKWLIMQLNNGSYGEGKQLIKPQSQHEMWSIQTPTPLSMSSPYETQFGGYGLGWAIADVKGMKQVGHTGGLLGTVTQIVMIPKLKLGIIVLTNQQSGAAFLSITNTIKDAYLGYEKRNWVKQYSERTNKMIAEAKATTDSIYDLIDKQIKFRLKYPATVIGEDKIVGDYEDKVLGKVRIFKEHNSLRVQFVRSPRLIGTMMPLNATTWVAHWDDRSYDADAYMELMFDHTGKATQIKMKAISPMTDFSFDFHNLEIRRVQ